MPVYTPKIAKFMLTNSELPPLVFKQYLIKYNTVYIATATTSSAKRKTCPVRCTQDAAESDNSGAIWWKYLKFEEADDEVADDGAAEGGSTARATTGDWSPTSPADPVTEPLRSADREAIGRSEGRQRTDTGGMVASPRPPSLSRDSKTTSSASTLWSTSSALEHETEPQNDRDMWLVSVYIHSSINPSLCFGVRARVPKNIQNLTLC